MSEDAHCSDYRDSTAWLMANDLTDKVKETLKDAILFPRDAEDAKMNDGIYCWKISWRDRTIELELDVIKCQWKVLGGENTLVGRIVTKLTGDS